MVRTITKYPSPMPPAAKPERPRKLAAPSKRRTFYSDITIDEITREHWSDEIKKHAPKSPLPWVPPCCFSIPAWIFFIPVAIFSIIFANDLIDERNAKPLLEEMEKKWFPNREKLGLFALKGCLGMSSKAAAVELHNSLLSSLGVRYKAHFKLQNLHVVVALISSGVESLGMTKLYLFLKPVDDHSCTVYCRAYKRFLAPGEAQKNTVVDKPTRIVIARLLAGLNVQEVQLEQPLIVKQETFESPKPQSFTLEMLANAESNAKSMIEQAFADVIRGGRQ
jgi:hypothetical protein